jgi:hypothetical protein
VFDGSIESPSRREETNFPSSLTGVVDIHRVLLKSLLVVRRPLEEGAPASSELWQLLGRVQELLSRDARFVPVCEIFMFLLCTLVDWPGPAVVRAMVQG